jgi:hypothetical protein
MSYEQYPTSAQTPQTPQRGQPPASVQKAVKCMYAGAALSAIELIIGLATIGSIKTAIQNAYPKDTASQVHSLEVSSIVLAVIVGLISVGLWVWMARASGSGHSYGRIVGTVLFALNTIFLLLDVARPHASLGLILNILVWLAGLGAVIFLWSRESGAYFKPQTPV